MGMACWPAEQIVFSWLFLSFFPGTIILYIAEHNIYACTCRLIHSGIEYARYFVHLRLASWTLMTFWNLLRSWVTGWVILEYGVLNLGRQNQFCPFSDNHVHFAPLRHQYVQSCLGPFRFMVCHVNLVTVRQIMICIVTLPIYLYSDFNDDDAICVEDLNKMMDLLTGGKLSQTLKDKVIDHVRLVVV